MPYAALEDQKAYDRSRKGKRPPNDRKRELARAAMQRLREKRGVSYKIYQHSKVLKKNYGMTIGDLERMRTIQEDKCAACGNEFEETPHIDHDHITRKVRGLLCSSCNRTIGHAKENVERLIACGIYLEKCK